MATKHLSQIELAARWNISHRTLERWRWTGEGPKFIKLGGRVIYRLEDVEAFEAEHSAIIARGGTAIIPIRKNGRPWKEDCPAARARNETLRATRHYGRAFWKRWAGYHARSRAEAKMRCLKSFGERIAARDPDRQTAEIHIRVALINRFNALGSAEIVRAA